MHWYVFPFHLVQSAYTKSLLIKIKIKKIQRFIFEAFTKKSLLRNLTRFYGELFRLHCVKSVQIRSYFWSVFTCIWTEYREIRTRNNSVLGHFSRSVGYPINVHNRLFVKNYDKYCRLLSLKKKKNVFSKNMQAI